MTRNPPPTPDFAGAATQQGNENRRAATDQSTLNNPNFHGIGGSQTVTYGADGRPVITQTLDPNQQRLYDQYTANQGAAGDAAARILGRANLGQIDTSNLGELPKDYNGTRDSVINAMLSRSLPALDRQADQTNSDLIARGIRPGTEAYERERDALNRQKNDAMQQAQIAGGDAATKAMASDLARRGQLFGEDVTQANQPMSVLSMLLNGSRYQQPNMPGFNGNTQVAPAPVYGAATAGANYNTDVWNAQQAQRNSQLNGGLGLLGGLLGMGNNTVGGQLLGNLPSWLSGLFGNSGGEGFDPNIEGGGGIFTGSGATGGWGDQTDFIDPNSWEWL